MTKLKPCPFCGGEAEIVDLECYGARYYVKCTNGCVEQSGLYGEKAKAINLWNKREDENEAGETPMTRSEFMGLLHLFNEKAWEIASRRKEEKDEHTD